MFNSDLVSIILPTFNHAHFLSRAIESVLSQTYTNWELIIIDNYSKDRTDEVINQFKDFRIKVLKVQNNGVIAVSRNMGIDMAKGTWIAFLDSDDWWTSDKLKVCIEKLNEEIDFVFHDLSIVGIIPASFRSKVLKGKHLVPPITKDLLVNGNIISNSSVIVRKSILLSVNKIDESKEMIASEDYNTWLKISAITSKFLYIPKNMGFYMVHPDGMSKKNMSISMQFACRDFFHLLDSNERKYYGGRMAYVKGDFFQTKEKYSLALLEFYMSIKLSKYNIKIKALYQICNIYLKKYFNK
uniref:glycosyltransferase family 2 protein n=1 Tax=Algoriphagus sp. TaxID=1872435 RepID=UPI0040476352